MLFPFLFLQLISLLIFKLFAFYNVYVTIFTGHEHTKKRSTDGRYKALLRFSFSDLSQYMSACSRLYIASVTLKVPADDINNISNGV